MTEPSPTPAHTPSLAADIARLAGVMAAEHYPNGERAALRRWAPGQPVPLALYRLWLRHLGRDLPPESQTEAWMAIAWGLATAGPDSHDPQRPWGQALAESGYAEGRLDRLLSAPEELRLDLYTSAVRFLAAKGERFDWQDAALFLLTTDPAKREGLHRRIASRYYRHLPQS